MHSWSDATTSRGDGSQTLMFAIHDVPFVVRSNDATVIAHVTRLVRRYSGGEPQTATGVQQVLVAVQGVPALDASRLKDVPRRSGTHKPARVATTDANGGRVIYRRDTDVMTYIQRNIWTITGDLRAHPGEVTRALDAMLSLALVERGYLTLKSSAVTRDGVGIALVGGPDSARRALAVTLLTHGFRWVTEDLLLVRVTDGEIEMRGLPGLLRLNPGAMLAHPTLRATLTEEERTRYDGQNWRELRELDTRYMVDAAETFGIEGVSSGSTLRAVIALRWRASDPAESATLVPLARADAYEALADASRSYGLYDLSGTLPPNYHRLSRIAETVMMRAITGSIAIEEAATHIAQEIHAVSVTPPLVAPELA